MELSNGFSNYSTLSENGCQVFCGAHAASAHLLSICAKTAAEQPLRLLDFGNRCDMYFAARQLRTLTRDPAAAMKNIRLQRAFTCYQAQSLLRQLDPFETDMPVFILDMLAPFLDENIKTTEIARLFRDACDRIRVIQKTRRILIGVKPLPKRSAPERMFLLKGLAHDFGMVILRGVTVVPELENSQPPLFTK